MGDSSHETSMLLGEMKAQIATLTAALNNQAAKSEAGRERVYRELEDMRFQQANITDDIRHMKDRLDKSDPVLSLVSKWEERVRGMVMILLMIGMMIGGGVAYFWKWLAAKFGVV